MVPSHRQGRDLIARHGETVFNAARRLQGDHPHTPLTRAGFAQAEEMGRALRAALGARPALTTTWLASDFIRSLMAATMSITSGDSLV